MNGPSFDRDEQSIDNRLADLRSLLTKTVAAVGDVTDPDTVWDNPYRYSQAGRELIEQESRCLGPQTGSWPWLTSLLVSRWALQAATEEAKGLRAVLTPDATSYAADVLCRGVLDAASLAWWLLDPNIGADRRQARSMVYRLSSAHETKKALDALGLDPGEDPSEYAEMPGEVESQIRSLGTGWQCEGSGRQVSWGKGKETWPSYTDRVTDLVRNIWPQPSAPYRILSAVAHAGLWGLTANIARMPDDGLRPTPGRAIFWLWHDAYLALGALVWSAHRVANFLGLHQQVAAIEECTGELNSVLPLLRPDISHE